MVTAAIHGQTESIAGFPSMYSPMVPSAALQNSRPIGLILCTIGPAKKRRKHINTLVQMNASVAFVSLFNTCLVTLVIQLSVPSSTYPTRACMRYRNASTQEPSVKFVAYPKASQTTPATTHPIHAGAPKTLG